ncbi:hypothetical protein DERF_010977 [Dermatophagoides farinae]|uniref:Uncharacterized protein n=1 Tax=Dermatophagoides farinae TaxID=6954 RepID=A0A922HS03_DERFA|nr:hypothetical protein DERF_010977 [Dermatophagoides farinae]
MVAVIDECVTVHVCKNRNENGPLSISIWIGGCSGGQPEIVRRRLSIGRNHDQGVAHPGPGSRRYRQIWYEIPNLAK